MDEQRQDDQLEPIYNSSVPIQDVALKTSRERWTTETGGERGSGRSVLAARHDDDDDDDILQIFTPKLNSRTHQQTVYVTIYIYILKFSLFLYATVTK